MEGYLKMDKFSKKMDNFTNLSQGQGFVHQAGLYLIIKPQKLCSACGLQMFRTLKFGLKPILRYSISSAP
jgi:hypothetical protein